MWPGYLRLTRVRVPAASGSSSGSYDSAEASYITFITPIFIFIFHICISLFSLTLSLSLFLSIRVCTSETA